MNRKNEYNFCILNKIIQATIGKVNNMKIDDFYKDTLILTISNLATGILRFVFSIILSNKLGAEGLGLFSIIMPVYDLFCCLVCGGLIVALSRKSAMLYTKNDFRNINKLMKTSFIFILFWSLLISILVYFNSRNISIYFIKDVRTINSLRLICPALIFVALSNVYKGYFYGISKAKIPAFIDIIEKAIRIAVTIGIINYLFLIDITKTVTAVYGALTVGEFISFIFLYFAFVYYRSKYKGVASKAEKNGQLLFDILIVSIPLCINGFLSSILNAACTLIVPRRLVAAGLQYDYALSLIGKFNGMALNITFFPMIIIVSMCTVLVPDISKKLSERDKLGVEERIVSVIKLSFYIGISTMIICLCIPKNLGQLFFNRNDLGSFIITSSICAPITFAAASTYSILSGLGKQGKILVNSLLVSVEDLVLLYVLAGIKQINIYSFAIALFITSTTSYMLNMWEIKKTCALTLKFRDIFIDSLLCILIFFILGILNNTLPNALKTTFIIVLGFSLFFFTLSSIKKYFD